MALHPGLDAHLRAKIGAAGYTVSGSTATITGSTDHHTLDELLSTAWNTKHEVTIAAGVVKVAPANH